MTGKNFNVIYFFCVGALAVVLALAPGTAPYAQASGDDEVIEEIITIGTPGGAGIQKRDVWY